MKFTELKDKITISPRNCLSDLRLILRKAVKSRVADCTTWMETHRRELRIVPENVDQFVKQIQCLEYVEDNFQSIKEKLE